MKLLIRSAKPVALVRDSHRAGPSEELLPAIGDQPLDHYTSEQIEALQAGETPPEPWWWVPKLAVVDRLEAATVTVEGDPVDVTPPAAGVLHHALQADDTGATIGDVDGTEIALDAPARIDAWQIADGATVAAGDVAATVVPITEMTGRARVKQLLEADDYLRDRWDAATELRSDDAQVRGVLEAAGVDPDVILAP